MHARARRTTQAGIALVAAAFLAIASPASAQLGEQIAAWDGQGFIMINGGQQLLTGSFTDRGLFQDSRGAYLGQVTNSAALESSAFNTRYRGNNGRVFDVNGAAKLYRNFALMLGFSRFSHDQGVGVTGQIPHPFYFGEDYYRDLEGEGPPVARAEYAVHLAFAVVVPATPSFQITIFGGPSFYQLSHDLVSNVLFTQQYPYETADYAGVTVSNRQGSRVGFNGGGDVSYYFTETVGLGVLARYNQAKAELRSVHGGEPVQVQVGGLHLSGGLRLRF